MKLHADLQRPAAVRGTDVQPVPSPVVGVERRMLERDGNEVQTLASNPDTPYSILTASHLGR
jgi:hypothetical protein